MRRLLNDGTDRGRFLATVLGVVLAFLLSSLTRHIPIPERPYPLDPSYSPRQTRICPTPPIVDYNIPVSRPCIHVTAVTATTITANLTLTKPNYSTVPISITAQLTPHLPPAIHVALASIPNANDTTQLTYHVSNLTASTDYTLDVHAIFSTHPRSQHLCTSAISTAPHGANLLQNPSFEEVADAPFAATRPVSNHANPRQWTPFYNGGAERICATFPLPHTRQVSVAPRSGNCLLALARAQTDWHLPRTSRHFGAHQAIPLPDVTGPVAVSAWYIHFPRPVAPRPNVKGPEDPSPSPSAASLVVGWTFANGHPADGVTVSLSKADDWTPICVVLYPTDSTPLRMLHVYIHNDDDERTEALSKGTNTTHDAVLLLDDVSVWLPRPDTLQHLSHCHSVWRTPADPAGTPTPAPTIHLRATQRAAHSSLTAAVPLTSDRVLRLETLSRQFGGGAISAAVAVASDRDMDAFAAVWRSKAWLRSHVDVTFVRRFPTGERGGKGLPLAINALRNIAVRIAVTEFVIMLDVDMTPAPHAFDCVRGNGGNVLSSILAQNTRRVIAVVVFITDVQQRAAMDKEEQRHMLVRHVGTAYCASSQRATRLKTWVSGYGIRRTRFQPDYEPYALARREDYPKYDERFQGYGFNKISWLLKAEAAGWSVLSSAEWFVTHLNHVENDWVSGIDEEEYLQTWRRYLALAAEVGDVRAGSESVGGVTVVE